MKINKRPWTKISKGFSGQNHSFYQEFERFCMLNFIWNRPNPINNSFSWLKTKWKTSLLLHPFVCVTRTRRVDAGALLVKKLLRERKTQITFHMRPISSTNVSDSCLIIIRFLSRKRHFHVISKTYSHEKKKLLRNKAVSALLFKCRKGVSIQSTKSTQQNKIKNSSSFDFKRSVLSVVLWLLQLSPDLHARRQKWSKVCMWSCKVM